MWCENCIKWFSFVDLFRDKQVGTGRNSCVVECSKFNGTTRLIPSTYLGVFMVTKLCKLIKSILHKTRVTVVKLI